MPPTSFTAMYSNMTFLSSLVNPQETEENISWTSAATPTSAINFTTTTKKPGDVMTWDDATWILTSSFIIFTMQSGFGLLEAGSVSSKNEVNIMVKNAVDVIFGGLTYWAFGYGLALGTEPGSTPFYGFGQFAVDSTPETMGVIHATFIFQLSFATTATTIVSGAMAERTKLSAYIVFSLLNTVVYCIPAHWLWADNGFLHTLGAIDIAGSGGVHLVGGTSGLIATLLLKPRIGKYRKKGSTEEEVDFQPGNPTNCLVGTFMLWWGWLGFNCGSTFGISGGKWKMAAKSAVTTILSSMGGGLVGLSFSYVFRNRIFDIADLVNAILGALVAVTAGCALVRPWEAVVIGITGALLVVSATILFEKLHIDDPVGALSVHGIGGIWGMIVVGLLVEDDPTVNDYNKGNLGLFKGGGFYLLGVQLLACVCVMTWAGAITFILLMAIKQTIGLRMSAYEELVGADYVEHRVGTIAERHEEVEHHRETCLSDVKGVENGGYTVDYDIDFGNNSTRRDSRSDGVVTTPGSTKFNMLKKRSSYGFRTKAGNRRDSTDSDNLNTKTLPSIKTISETGIS